MKFLSATEALRAFEAHPDDPLGVLRALGGYYTCPKGPDGKRHGPLVGYVGMYDGPDGTKLHYVGDEYADFAFAERYPHLLLRWTSDLAKRVPPCDVVCGAPLGGMATAQLLALALQRPYVFPEKVVTAAKTEHAREQATLVFGRHGFDTGQKVLLVEDVVNNLTTTGQGIDLIRQHGGKGVGIACLLNRSVVVDDTFRHGEDELPIGSLVRKAISQYRQDDPFVADDVAANNVVWKPKPEWTLLEAAMAAAAQV